jgi:hypothetical protein
MGKGKDRNYVSFWFWFLMPVVLAIPCVGFILTIVLAFVGDNESRKNFFRAALTWWLIVILIWVAMLALGLTPFVQAEIQKWLHPPGK